METKNKIRLFLLAFLALIATRPALAQTMADSFAGFSQKSSNEPIDIEADSLEVLDDKKVAIFSGNVRARQGKFELISKQIKVTYSGGLGGENKNNQKGTIKTIEATGKVAISTPDNQTATSDWAKFEVAEQLVTIGGNVVLSQDGNVMRGDKLLIDLKNGRSRFDATTQTEQGKTKRPRISGVFLPGKVKDKNKSSNAKPKNNNESATSQPQQPAQAPPLPWQRDDVMTGN